VAIEDKYYGTSWRISPDTGELFQVIGDEVTNFTGNLNELTGGELTGGPGYIRNNLENRFVWGVGRTYPTTMHVSPTGVLTIEREVDPNEVNAQVYSRGRYGAVGVGEVVLPDGSVRQVDVTSWLTKIGEQLLIKSGSEIGDNERYSYLADLYPQGAELPLTPPDGWEFAQPGDALRRGLSAQLLKEHEDLIEDAIAQGMEGADGKPMTKKYDVAVAIAGMLEQYPTLAAVLIG
jgi:hypothetical protein